MTLNRILFLRRSDLISVIPAISSNSIKHVIKYKFPAVTQKRQIIKTQYFKMLLSRNYMVSSFLAAVNG